MLRPHNKLTIGQSLVEFALIIPALLFSIFGIFEFGRVLQVWMTVQNSAQAAARFAATGEGWQDGIAGRLGNIKAEARSKAISLAIINSAGPSSPGYFHVYVYASDPPVRGTEFPGGPNARVAVDVIFNHPLTTPFLNGIVQYIKLSAHSEMINEQFRHPGYGTPSGVLPPTIFPTPVPTNTPRATATATLPALPTFTATIPTSTFTSTIPPTYTTVPTHIFPTNTPTPIRGFTSTPCPWWKRCP